VYLANHLTGARRGEAQVLRIFAEVDVTAKVEDQSWVRWERMMRVNVVRPGLIDTDIHASGRR